MRNKTVRRCAAFIFATIMAVSAMTTTAYANGVTIINSYANCRQNPGASNRHLGKVYAGQTYELLDTGKAPNGKLWYQIDKGGKAVWICSAFARVNKEPATQNKKPAAQSKTRFNLSEADRRYIASVVSAEARGESYKGQMAVAQVIYDRAVKNKQTPLQVVKAPAQFAQPWGGGSKYTESCYKAVCAVFDNGERVTERPMYYFMMLNCYPSWLKGKTWVMTEGNHKFYC